MDDISAVFRDLDSRCLARELLYSDSRITELAKKKAKSQCEYDLVTWVQNHYKEVREVVNA